MSKIYTKAELLKRLKQEGFTASYNNFILRYERSGQFKPRRNPLNDHRQFTKKDIEEIVQAIKDKGKDFHWEAK